MPPHDTIQEAAELISYAYRQVVEAELILAMEALLGRVPSNEEVAEHCTRRVDWPERSMAVYFWDDTILFAIRLYFQDCKAVVEVKRRSEVPHE